ncbi:MAG: ADP-ribosylglycohydrolase family protein [Bacteroidales bacterium]|nr:ADP-ribosylglycohydrolase family protein [Bacteroidales bacterium]MCF8334596.1 ADP-ribosylglycohydrolase family protein [Bacteroidales bacterium]
MIGALAGDIIGSVYEAHPIKTKNFPLFKRRSHFTDDSVLTIAIGKAIIDKGSYLAYVKKIGRSYPHCGYGGSFIRWLLSESTQPYHSFGNGAAMRVSPVGFAFESEEEVLQQAQETAEITHNHPEGIKGAQAVVLAVYLARTGKSKEEIRSTLAAEFEYDLDRTVESIRPTYHFDITCQGSVPEAIIAFLDPDSYEDAVRNAVSLGGDSDTLACMTGGIAEAFYREIPKNIIKEVKSRLTEDLWASTKDFYKSFGIKELKNLVLE